MTLINRSYSTTRTITLEQPIVEKQPTDTFETVLFLPEGEGRQGEGGLRTQGYFKLSLLDKPLITVITVVFNGAKHLEETILSVINQTYDNVEYIIIDGGSTDGTLDIIRQYEHAIDYWVSEKDGGIYDAMNKGIQLATGESIGIINSDDWYELKTTKLIASHKKLNYKIFHGSMNIFNTGNFLYQQKFSSSLKKLHKGMIIAHPTVFVGQKIYKENGYFDLNYKIAADWELMLRLYLKCYNFEYIADSLANFRVGGLSSNITLTSSLEKSAIRKKNCIYKTIDKYMLIDLVKIFIFRKKIHQISIAKNKYINQFFSRND